MNYYGYDFIRESDLAHHGIKGQKWGQRRFQNEDGTLTAAGKKRYSSEELRTAAKHVQEYNAGKMKNRARMSMEKRAADARYEREGLKLRNAQSKMAPKDYDKAWDGLGKDLERQHSDADRKQAERDKKLESDLTKKYGVDVSVSMKAIQSNPLKTAMALVGKNTSSNTLSKMGNRLVDPHGVKMPNGMYKGEDPSNMKPKVRGGGVVLSDGADDYQPKRPRNAKY